MTPTLPRFLYGFQFGLIKNFEIQNGPLRVSAFYVYLKIGQGSNLLKPGVRNGIGLVATHDGGLTSQE